MTEGMMSPERQGWFAGVKDKLRKSFTVEGSKEKFYQKNADLISKATATLSSEDKQAAYTQIEQDALSSAKIDVATHWGALVLGTAAAGLGGVLLTDKVRGRVGEMGPMGKRVADFGQKAKDGLVRIVGKFNFRREGSSLATKGMPTREQRLRMQVRNQEIYAKQAVKDAAAKGLRIPGAGKAIDPDSVTPISDVLHNLRLEGSKIRKRLLDQRIQGEARKKLENDLADIYSRRKNLRAK